MKAAKILIAVCLATSLAACAGRTTPVVVSTTVEKPELALPDTDKVRLRDVDWVVITSDVTTEQALNRARSNSLFAVSPKGYENLSLNTAEMTKSILQLQAQIRAYEEYYKKTEGSNNGGRR